MKVLLKYIKKKKKALNEISIVINIAFLAILLFEFFYPSNAILKNIQIVLWIYFMWELYMRMKFHKFKLKYIFSIFTIIDTIIIILIFIRFFYVDSTLLHFFTALKVFRAYRIIHELSKVNTFFRNNQNLIVSVINLFIFTFFMASLVFIEQFWINKNINNFLDALYFTISTLTTTWFWDIIVSWNEWKVLVILIMTLWTWLFLRLITVIFRPIKKVYECKFCWLQRHDRDASHCKHCWNIIFIENSGELQQ